MANNVVGEHMAFEHATRLIKAYRFELQKAKHRFIVCNVVYLIAIGVLVWMILR